MTGLDFTASAIHSLAWPLLILALVLIFHDQIIALAGKLASFEGFGLKVNFSEGVDQLAAQVEEPAPSPARAPKDGPAMRFDQTPGGRDTKFSRSSRGGTNDVLKAWLRIEQAIRDAATENDVRSLGSKPLEILADLEREDILGEDTVAQVEEARKLRNAVAHGQATDFTSSAARRYVETASLIVSRIRNEAGLS
jgi:hypothetical protein